VWIARVSLSASVKLTLRWETQDDLMSRYNVLWKTSSAQAARAQGNEDKLQDLRNERQRLREANKNKDAELLASKKCVLESEEQVRKERESVRQERDQEAARFRRQLQERGASAGAATVSSASHGQVCC
jgi:predicted  nucleic acid-binding Zn-ribbon protein